jgi:methyl-accepting chemotaxis protein/NAD-dependent dihydropyrimidine dehydrogenase PreA subunit
VVLFSRIGVRSRFYCAMCDRCRDPDECRSGVTRQFAPALHENRIIMEYDYPRFRYRDRTNQQGEKVKLTKVVGVDTDKCVNCHRCIAVCPVKYCNDGSGNHVGIREDLCIGCGECLKACPHQARIGLDDFDALMAAVKKGEKIVAIVAPAIAAEFPNRYLNFNGWLKSLGVSALFDVSFGAELTVKSYLEHIRQNKPKAVISQPCPAIVSYIEIFQPELLKYLAPADSPMMHTIKLIKEFYPKYAYYKILIVSPCVAKKREFDEVGLGDYNVTMKKFSEYIAKERIDLTRYPQTAFDNDPAERAVLFSTPGGLLRTVQREVPGITKVARKIEGPATVYHYLAHLEKDIARGVAPLLIDCLNCDHGCNGGTGTSQDKSQDELEHLIEKRNQETQKVHRSGTIFKSKFLSKRKLGKVIDKFWKKDLYHRTYQDLSDSNFKDVVRTPEKKDLEAIYREMLKENKDDLLNCGSCGYHSCEEMATAIFNGLNKKENCHRYEKNYFTGSVNVMLTEMEKFAAGDLTVELHSVNDDEVAKFYAGFNRALENIRHLLSGLISLINETASASNEISSSTEQMAAGAQEQSSQTAEVAGAIEQMAKTITETTRHSGKASDAAKSAGMIAIEGGKVVADTIEGMNRMAEVVKESADIVLTLGKSSDQIGEIVQVIDDIADQTNLLALNAAIEAARAGEQGRGFAVVADEVRKLAERTTKATKEIAQMIKRIQKDTGSAVVSMKDGRSEVEKSKALAEKAGRSLREIITGAEEVVDMSTRVAVASGEQAGAAEQISRNIESISAVTQQSAAGIQQIAHTAEDLNRLTSSLQQLIANFKLHNHDSAGTERGESGGSKKQLPLKSIGAAVKRK